MMVEIKGVQFVNKGAELMLLAVIEQVRERYPHVQFVLNNRGTYASYQDIASLGCYQKLYANRRGYNLLAPATLIPRKLLFKFGLVPEAGIDVVLDASGFVYHSKGGTSYIRETARRIGKWKRSGKKVIFLPQAFGPFMGKKDKRWMEKIIENADLVFARDDLSCEHLNAINKSSKIKTYPDFTNLLDGQLQDRYRYLEERVPVIPNQGMTKVVHQDEGQNYVSFMATAMKYLYKEGCAPYFLMHESIDDKDVVRQIMERAGREFEIVSESDPLVVKGIIGVSKGVLSSRFHGLVNALSQGVPALGTGWSHKYDALFADYRFQEGLLSLNDSQDMLDEKLGLITDQKRNLELRQKLEKMSEVQKDLSLEMWSRIFNVMDG